MTTHYAQARTALHSNNIPLCGHELMDHDTISTNFKRCDCRDCIDCMTSDQRRWHEQNQEYNELIGNAGAIR